jgi:YD repeat-containing protein
MNKIYTLFAIGLFSFIWAWASYANTYTYDALNRLIAVTHQETSQVTHYTYDAGGNLLSVTTAYKLEIYTQDQEDQPLAGVSITLNGQTITSDENGYLQFTNLLAGTYTLIATKDQHNFTPQEITIGENTAKTLNISSDGLTQCQLYVVHDASRNDSQFITIDSQFNLTLLGSLYKGYDIEAMDAHPKTAQILVAAGDQSVTPGALYLLNAQTGKLTFIGDTGFDEINGLSFKPEGTLWGAAEKAGLIQIDPLTAASTLIIAYKGPVEDFTWDNEGQILYVIQNQELVAYDSQAAYQMWPLDCQGPQGEIEALEMLPDNRLLLGVHNDNTLSIHALDLDSCELQSIPLNLGPDIGQPLDIEGIAWPKLCASQ